MSLRTDRSDIAEVELPGDRVNDLIEAKKNEREFRPAAEPPAATNVADLAEALRASVDAAKKAPRRTPSSGSKPGKAAGTAKAGAEAGKKKPPAKGRARAVREARGVALSGAVPPGAPAGLLIRGRKGRRERKTRS